MTQTLALVGAAGGAGTTRLAVEMGATLTRTGRDVAVVDAAYTTQGLADYVQGHIEADVTELVTDEAELAETLHPVDIDTPGTLSLAPARAPFERLARAKTAGAAERLEKHLAAAALSHDVVIVDVPPLGANQAVAAVNAADRVAVLAPDSERGGDALARTRARLDDIGSEADSVVANRAGESAVLTEADARVPASETTAPGECPAVLPPDETFAPSVAAATEATLEEQLDIEFETGGRLDGLLG